MNKQLLTIFVGLTSIALIWAVGPYVSVAGVTVFADFNHCLIATLIITVVCLLYLLFAKLQQDNKPSIDDSAAVAELDMLTSTFSSAKDFLKKAHVNTEQGKRYFLDLPHYLLIGAHGAGKTSLIANSRLRFLLAKKIKKEELEEVKSTRFCDWWVTKDSVIIDSNGNYAIHEEDDHKQQELWQHLLQLLKQHRQKQPLAGLIVVTDMIWFAECSEQERETYQQTLAYRLHELGKQLQMAIPVYLIFSKMDRLEGFREFFADLDAREREQAWGIQLPQQQQVAGDAVVLHFNPNFTQLMQRLNDRLLWRLHHEHDQSRRSKIKNFPAASCQS